VRGQAGPALGENEWDGYLRASRILLGLNQGRDASGRLRSYLKFRDIEFPGYGCCYLTNQSEDLESAFALGREVLGYRNLMEAAGVCRRLQTRPEEAREVGRRGRARVLENHTWAARLPEIRAALEGIGPA
jgi:spore maturation protein CgeB